MALAPQLSRAAYRRGYLQSLSRQAANEAYNLEANLRWLQDGDVEGEAEKAATIQAMARGAIDSKVIELVNYIVRQPRPWLCPQPNTFRPKEMAFDKRRGFSR